MMGSIVEEKLLSKEFPYWQALHQCNPYALRLMIGRGDTFDEAERNMIEGAAEIYHALFPNGADAFFFDYYVYDICEDGEAMGKDFVDGMEVFVEEQIKERLESDRFLIDCMCRYRHKVVRDMPPQNPSFFGQGLIRRNRMICYREASGIDFDRLIDRVTESYANMGFVSFDNECIFFLRGDYEGCVVCMTQEKSDEYRERLKPYLDP